MLLSLEYQDYRLEIEDVHMWRKKEVKKIFYRFLNFWLFCELEFSCYNIFFKKKTLKMHGKLKLNVPWQVLFSSLFVIADRST